MSIDEEPAVVVATAHPPDDPPSYEEVTKMSSETSNETPPPDTPATAEPTIRICTACTGETPAELLLELECGDSYCGPCLTTLFSTAMTDESMFPPRCCNLQIRLKKARPHIPKPVAKLFCDKQLELSTKNKIYCWKPRCSAFIAPHSVHNGQAYCQKCRAVTCSVCKNQEHFGRCTYAGDDEAFFEFVRKTRFKKCPVCRRMVEKNGGCNHIICRCRTEMCYGCGEESHECVCSGSEEEDDEVYGDDGDLGFGLFD